MPLGPLGDRALIARFSNEDEAARWVAAVRAAARGWPGIEDVVQAYQSAAIFADPDKIDFGELEARVRGLKMTTHAGPDGGGRLIHLPVLYDGIDLAEVARRKSLTEQEVIAHHTAHVYRVYAIGFLPGYPYLGYLPPELSGLPRRDSPRALVPAGTVAIAGRQTGVYPDDAPGGWHLLGRTPLRIVDLESGHFPISEGDFLRFEPIGVDEFEWRRGERL